MVALGSQCSWLDDCAEVIRENDNRLGGNHLYSVAALTDNSGNVVERYRYDAYGQRTVLAADGTTVRTSSAHGNQVGFTGRYLDKESGLWYFRARYYSGSLGRFVSRDPLGYVDGIGLYNGFYVPNYLDPSGLTLDADCTSTEIMFDASFHWGIPKAIKILGGSGEAGFRASIKGKRTICPCKCSDGESIEIELAVEFEAFGELIVNAGVWTGTGGFSGSGSGEIRARKECDGKNDGEIDFTLQGKLYASFGAGRSDVASVGVFGEGTFGLRGRGPATTKEALADVVWTGSITFGIYAHIGWLEYRQSLGEANWDSEPIGNWALSY